MADIEIVASAVGFDQVNKALDTTTKGLDDTAKSAKKAGDALNNGLKPGAAQANNAMVNLGRVVQDAPFGFIGVANNIDPLLGSFTRLKEETGSVGGALKALGGSLMGGGGLAFAVSAVTSLLVVFGDSLGGTSKSLDQVSDSTDDFINQMNAARTNLDALLFSIETANKIKSIDFKIANSDKFAQSTFDAANNVDLLDKKLVALADQYKELSSNIINVEREYDKLRQTEEGTNLPVTLNEASKAASGLTEDAKALVSQFSKLKDEQAKVNTDMMKYPELIKLAKKEQQLAIVEAERSKKAEKDKLDTLEKYLAKFRESVKDEINIGIAVGDPRFTERLKLFQGAIEGVISKFNQDPKSKLVIGLQTEMARLELEKFASEAPNVVQRKVDTTKPVDLSKLLKLDTNKLLKNIPPLKLDTWFTRTQEDFNKAFADFNATVLEESIITFADSIGGIITGQLTFGDAFKAVFASLADNIKQLGQQLIKIAILTKIAQEQLFTNPTAALAAGIGLVVLGSVLKNLMTSKKAFATGTSFAPGGLALVGERGPELVNVPRGSQVIPAAQTATMLGARNDIQVYGVIRGQDIYISNKRYSQTYNRQT